MKKSVGEIEERNHMAKDRRDVKGINIYIY